ncbi:1-acyl-sn-glycerol-3-phosphate acyltransferase [Treponema sp. Marseille-Q4132]|uniref:lysophospholipid acyltransferase family protein n=1 Tax=Treponema sp. Marseille-Q4132 TaxID=2766701 RepID=UPI0016530A76|nr:lysophospholipid acyltransferase family protein [Treponema sp. Marseille-Q4132]QNL97368.1 1-acyl-sn-glycerol-3-phosphate acyltransferase [Treponema sp. Marseille-Q4132]
MTDIGGIKSDTQREIQNRIRELEKKGEFDGNVQPIDYAAMIRVSDDYVFLPRTFSFFLWRVFIRTAAAVLGPVLTKFVLGARVEGRKNLCGVKGFVAVCNHVHSLDNMIVRQAVFGHTLYITVAEFNNMKGPIGSIMRGAGTLPFSGNVKAMNELQKTLSLLLKKGCAVLGYPEQSLWLRYEKPRPFHNGMFHIAAANKVPVVPMFITFSAPSKLRSLFSKKKVATLHIFPPIYPDENLSRKENAAFSMDKAAKAWRDCYVSVYGREADIPSIL